MTNVVFWLLVCDYCVLVSAVCVVGLFVVFLYMLYFIVSLGAQNTHYCCYYFVLVEMIQ